MRPDAGTATDPCFEDEGIHLDNRGNHPVEGLWCTSTEVPDRDQTDADVYYMNGGAQYFDLEESGEGEEGEERKTRRDGSFAGAPALPPATAAGNGTCPLGQSTPRTKPCKGRALPTIFAREPGVVWARQFWNHTELEDYENLGPTYSVSRSVLTLLGSRPVVVFALRIPGAVANHDVRLSGKPKSKSIGPISNVPRTDRTYAGRMRRASNT